MMASRTSLFLPFLWLLIRPLPYGGQNRDLFSMFSRSMRAGEPPGYRVYGRWGLLRPAADASPRNLSRSHTPLNPVQAVQRHTAFGYELAAERQCRARSNPLVELGWTLRPLATDRSFGTERRLQLALGRLVLEVAQVLAVEPDQRGIRDRPCWPRRCWSGSRWRGGTRRRWSRRSRRRGASRSRLLLSRHVSDRSLVPLARPELVPL